MSSILWATNLKLMFIMSNQNITTPEQPLKCHNCKSQRDKQPTIPFPGQPQKYHIWKFQWNPMSSTLWATNLNLTFIMSNQNITTSEQPLKWHNYKSQGTNNQYYPPPEQPPKYHTWNFQWTPIRSTLWPTNLELMLIMSNQNIVTQKGWATTMFISLWATTYFFSLVL